MKKKENFIRVQLNDLNFFMPTSETKEWAYFTRAQPTFNCFSL